MVDNSIQLITKHPLENKLACYVYSFITITYKVTYMIYTAICTYDGGVTTPTRPVSGEKHSSSGNLEILPGIRRLGNCSGKYDIVPGIIARKISEV